MGVCKAKSFFDFGRQSEKGYGEVQYILAKIDRNTMVDNLEKPVSSTGFANLLQQVSWTICSRGKVDKLITGNEACDIFRFFHSFFFFSLFFFVNTQIHY